MPSGGAPPIEPALGLLELEAVPAGIEAGDGMGQARGHGFPADEALHALGQGVDGQEAPCLAFFPGQPETRPEPFPERFTCGRVQPGGELHEAGPLEEAEIPDGEVVLQVQAQQIGVRGGRATHDAAFEVFEGEAAHRPDAPQAADRDETAAALDEVSLGHRQDDNASPATFERRGRSFEDMNVMAQLVQENRCGESTDRTPYYADSKRLGHWGLDVIGRCCRRRFRGQDRWATCSDRCRSPVAWS